MIYVYYSQNKNNSGDNFISRIIKESELIGYIDCMVYE